MLVDLDLTFIIIKRFVVYSPRVVEFGIPYRNDTSYMYATVPYGRPYIMY